MKKVFLRKEDMDGKNRLFDKIAIIGVGLIGGSLALKLKEKGVVGSITGIGRSRKNLETARALGMVDSYTHDVAEGVRGAGLIVVCVPVLNIAEVIKKALPGITSPCIITDVGSVKERIIKDVEAILPEGVEFVPAHPVAGTEESGAGAAFAELFQERLTIITPGPKTSSSAVQQVTELWTEVGSEVVKMNPTEHDRVFSLVSHLPHVIAYALVNTVACDENLRGGRQVLDYTAGGFKDFTRIASSSPEMWSHICSMNKDFLLEAIGLFEDRLASLKNLITSSDFEALKSRFERAKNIRDSLE